MQADYSSLGRPIVSKDVSFQLLQKAARRLQKTKMKDIQHAHHFIGTGVCSKEDPQQSHGPDWAEKFHHPHPPHTKLGQYASTAISGNDISSSCLYMTGLCVADAGVYAVIPLLLVAVTLYCFRSVYGEAVTGLPLNGGAYNILLNTTTKSTAATAAVLTILSYIATGVTSASTAISYLQNLWPELNAELGVLSLLGLFALLNIMGVSESARVALFIFIVHIITLVILVITALVVIFQDIPAANAVIVYNWNSPLQPSLAPAIFFGFSSAMLGVSGFETSANFVEEQKPGVFVKTLRNMWAVSSFFNPIFGVLVVLVLKLEDAKLHSGDALGRLSTELTGPTGWLTTLVSLDAFMVLSGAVLTSYVGVTGLCSRLAGDQCLPQFLLHENKCRRTQHRIIIGFFIACSLMYIVLNGNVEDLSSVYSIAFMSVMTLFAISTAMLKYKRGNLAREVRSSWLNLILATLLTVAAIISTLIKETRVLTVFAAYFCVTAAIMASMFFRLPLLNIIFSMTLELVNYWCPSWLPEITLKDEPPPDTEVRKQTIVLPAELTPGAVPGSVQFMPSSASGVLLESVVEDDSGPDPEAVGSTCCCLRVLVRQILNIGTNCPVLFFCKRGTISVMNRAILYIRKNEDARHVRIVHCYSEEKEIPSDLETSLRALDACYPKMKIDLILIKAPFGPAIISYLSTTLNTPRNLMFITCPGANFAHKIGDLGGVRLITH